MLMSSSSIWRAMATILPRDRLRGVQGKEPDPAAPMVYSALQGKWGGALHALALEDFSPQ